MSFDVLKKKIESMRAFVVSDSEHEDYWKRGYNIALNGVLEKIAELEKEKPVQLHSLECDCWSGRSEKEIREQIEYARENEFLPAIQNAVIDTLNWVLDPSEKKCEKKATQPNAEALGITPVTGECILHDGHEGDCMMKLKIPSLHGGYIDEEVSSAPKEKCEHVPSNVGCLVMHSHGKQCVTCAKCGKWSSEWEDVSREEKPKNYQATIVIPKKGVAYAKDFGDTIVQIERTGLQMFKAYIHVPSIPKDSLSIPDEEPVTLSEIADLMEKIFPIIKADLVLLGMEYERSIYFPFVTVYKDNIQVDLPRLFRERPDLVEKIRKGE